MNSEMVIEQIGVGHAAVLKATRLRAPSDSPTAFSSTFASETALSDQDWRQRALNCSGETAIGFLALQSNEGCGIVRGSPDDHDSTLIWVESMWVAPSFRRAGVGRLLVEQVLNWGRARNCRGAMLEVTNTNLDALRFYEKLGFVLNGRTSPFAHNSGLLECEMFLPLC